MGESVLWSYDAVLAAEAVSAAKARDFVRGHLLAHDLTDLVEDVRLVVSELATNAMVHAQTPFTVTLEGRESTVLLIVSDGSPVAPVRVAAHPLDTGGRGLSIVDLVSRDWGATRTADGAKSVWASFDARTLAATSR